MGAIYDDGLMLTILQAAHESVGGYAEKWTDTEGVVHRITEWQTGYNTALKELRDREAAVHEWFDTLPGDITYEISRMISNSDLFLNFDKDGKVIVSVNCNDLFAWACADSEDVTPEELPAVIAARKTGTWGTDAWVCKRRNQKPQPPVVKMMKENGVWDEDMESLGTNWQDAETKAVFAHVAAMQKV